MGIRVKLARSCLQGLGIDKASSGLGRATDAYSAIGLDAKTEPSTCGEGFKPAPKQGIDFRHNVRSDLRRKPAPNVSESIIHGT